MIGRAEVHPDPAYAIDPPVPGSGRPIAIVGAGGIVRDAHLPAYRRQGFEVAAIVDRVPERARALAREFGIPAVHAELSEATAAAAPGTVWDVAVTPDQHERVLSALPVGSAALIQKPLGDDLATALRIARICRERELVAAVNTQLRFAPVIAEARRLIAGNVIGELVDLEIRVVVETPWARFPHVRTLERLEIAQHSIHYLDLVRSFLGDPAGIDAVSVPFPGSGLANTRTTMLLRYPERPIRVTISVDHDHVYGRRHQDASVRWEGTRGALHAQLGALLDYPRGEPDSLELADRADTDRGWRTLAVDGSWFPDAFGRSMGSLQNHLIGRSPTLPHAVDDVLGTMRLVDAAERSAA